MAYDYKNLPVLSKVKIGEQTYYLKDAEVRALLDNFGDAVNYNVDKEFNKDSANLCESKAIATYLENAIAGLTGAMHFAGVKEALPADSEGAAGDVIIVGTAEYVHDGSKWVLIGDEGVYATVAGVEAAYVKKTLTIAGINLEDAITADELKEALGLKALAYKDSASGTVAGQTISGVKATGKSAGSINVTLSETESTVASSGDYTPVGTVSGGKVTAAGTVAVSFTNADAAAVVSTADYQPAGTVAVSLSNNEINEVTEIKVTSSHVDPVYALPKLETEDVNIDAHNSLTATVDEAKETLEFTSAMLDAISFKAVKNWTAGSKTSDGSFSVSATPVTAPKTVGVGSATFTGTVAEDLKVTGVTYKKHDGASATFTGSEVDVTGASFSGTAATINVTGAGKAYAVATKEFIPGDLELAVGDIAVAAKEVTVQ